MNRPGKPAKKYSQAARLHDVIRILEARYGATVDELADECAVNRRTVFRDLQWSATPATPGFRAGERWSGYLPVSHRVQEDPADRFP
jgi:hypothetical protein